MKCVCKNCQFESILKKDNDNGIKLYFEDLHTKDIFCIFHTPATLKEEFSKLNNKVYDEYIDKYIEHCINHSRTINFNGAIFNFPFNKNNLNASLLYFNFTTKNEIIFDSPLDIDFSNTIFLKYFRMDNLKCRKLIFKDTEFHNGGGIKNRNSEDNVYIENLEFRPYKLESDFVIDIGKYANKNGLLESSTGTIKKIRFENHKISDGVVYFIGFNNKLEEADFRNMILDNVSFQNCDLSKCYFLNTKVDETEFRNCKFPVQQDFHDGFIYALISGILSGILVVYQDEVVVYPILVFIFSILFFLTFSLNSHLSIIDEKKIITKDKNEKLEVWKAISEVYRSLKDNLSTNDYQRGGDFFYAQRFSQLQYISNKYDKFLYFLHYVINGFGENFLRPLIIFILIIILFSGYYETNKDYIATDQTPQFLVLNNKPINDKIPYYKNQIYLDKNKTLKQRQYVPNYLLFIDKNNTNTYIDNSLPKEVGLIERFKVKFLYSASQFISPFTAKNRGWFKTVSFNALLMNTIETILLYLFFGAFILAVKNRIKR